MRVREKSVQDLGVAQLVARYLGVVEAASSSLVTQTNKREMINLPFFLCIITLLGYLRVYSKMPFFYTLLRSFSMGVTQFATQQGLK